MESARITLPTDPPKIATSAIASRMSGNAIIASISRDRGVSSRRKNPAKSPITTPATVDTTVTPSPISSDTRPA